MSWPTDRLRSRSCASTPLCDDPDVEQLTRVRADTDATAEEAIE